MCVSPLRKKVGCVVDVKLYCVTSCYVWHLEQDITRDVFSLCCTQRTCLKVHRKSDASNSQCWYYALLSNFFVDTYSLDVKSSEINCDFVLLAALILFLLGRL